VTFEVFQLDISGNDINELQKLNIKLISVTLEVFQLEISGNNINDLQS
jgi:Leucine-rich repeat (LRR) protein